jgi:mannose-6-phosphate isomerase-like protein (cupin superfamily)
MRAREAPPFPGCIGVSHLRVYDSEAPDGLRGGTPHIHTVCTEAYAVVAGRGAVQTLSADGFAETELEPGAFVWFTPGTVHRLVNLDGQLEILVIMQNSGLPEAGDMVCTFPSSFLADRAQYDDVAVLPATDVDTRGPGDAARHRRDLAVMGFAQIRESGDLDGFLGSAATLVRSRVEQWRTVWEDGAAAAATATGIQLQALADGDWGHLRAASVHRLEPPDKVRRYGCCGTLGVYAPRMKETS